MAIKFVDLVTYTFDNEIQNLVDEYNNMTDNTSVQGSTVDEMRKILYWSFAAMHKLNNLAWLDENGNSLDQITDDAATEFTAVLKHNLVLLVNNWRQTQFFQKDANGKDITESKFNPIDNQLQTVTNPTNAAQVSYNLFDINLKSDKNLSQVSQLLRQIKHEYEQYLDIYGGAA